MELFGSSICCGIQHKMTTSAAWHICNASRLGISRDGVVAGLRESPGALGSSLAVAELQLGRRISNHGLVGCSNFPPGGASQVQGPAPRLQSSLAATRQPPLALRRVRAGNKLENDREEAVGSSRKAVADEELKSGEKTEGGLVERIEAELGRQFGGPLWFAVLLFSLALFGGLYAFLIVKYADLSDIPILRGPQR